ncbi:Der1-like protein, partial [Fragilariopsis cylindrus CCMP1102]
MDDIVGKFQSLPLFTRTWLGLSIIVTAAVTLDVIHINQVVLDWGRIIPYNKILNKLWRLLTSFCYVGKFDQFNSLFLLFTIYVHSKGYEKNPFPAGSGSRTADSLFGIIFCIICLLITQPIPGYLFGTTYALYPIMTRNLTGSLLYLWSKRNPRVMIQLNFIPMEGRYLPFAHIGASLFMKNRLHELLHGFLIGHIYYFLIEVAPVLMGGKRILHTPRILVE